MSSELADLVVSETDDKMRSAVSRTTAEFSNIRTGRAAPALVEKLSVDYYGADVPLQQIAGFSVPEARQLVITPFDKTTMGAIEKAIQQSDLGLSPSNDGNNIRLNFPPLTQERRKELVRIVKQMAEDGRIALRNLRRAGRHDLEELKKEGDLSEDELARYEKELDRMIHEHEAKVDEALQAKERELLED